MYSCRSISKSYTSSEEEVSSACVTQYLEVITSRSTVVLRKVPQLITTFPTIYGIQGSLPCSQQPTTGSYPEPDESNSNSPILSF